MNRFVIMPVLLMLLCAATLSARPLMRLTGWQTCGGGKIASDWAIYEVNANGIETLKGWLYKKCDGTSIWTPAQTTTHPVPNPDDAIEITTVPPPCLSEMQWGVFRSGRDAAVRLAMETGELTEMELMDDSDPNPGVGQHQTVVE